MCDLVHYCMDERNLKSCCPPKAYIRAAKTTVVAIPKAKQACIKWVGPTTILNTYGQLSRRYAVSRWNRMGQSSGKRPLKSRESTRMQIAVTAIRVRWCRPSSSSDSDIQTTFHGSRASAHWPFGRFRPGIGKGCAMESISSQEQIRNRLCKSRWRHKE